VAGEEIINWYAVKRCCSNGLGPLEHEAIVIALGFDDVFTPRRPKPFGCIKPVQSSKRTHCHWCSCGFKPRSWCGVNFQFVGHALQAPVAQRIEHWPPKPCAQVRLLSGAPLARALHPNDEAISYSNRDFQYVVQSA
jgi:hypothetical protein